INLAVRDLTIADISGEIVKNVSFTGNMDCKEMLRKNLRIENIKGSIKARKGVFHLKPLSIYVLGGKGEGNFTADISKADPTYSISLRIPRLDFEKLQESFGVRKVIGGKVDLTASLTAREKGGRTFLKGVYGTLSLRGNNLVTYTVDLDKVLSAFKASQRFSLLDIGAFFITGPLGSAALRGYRYGDLYYQTQGGRGIIRQFVSRWKIRNGEATATDCALATRRNRVALKGKLNLVEERYDNLVVALLDNKGCAKFKQGISGPFSSPQVGSIDVVESLAAPLLNLLKQTKRFVQGGRCQVFYNGSVPPPH
ncbi:MAG TPA: hypothetical protein DCR97_13900, partial [Deltaproteobacteria bacterium]|nr:hypothetical protein [Deltaproteobacteria bacterium]